MSFMRFISLVFISLCWSFGFSQNSSKKEYTLFRSDGSKISLEQLAKEVISESNVVLFGEFHDDSILHKQQQLLAIEMHHLLDTNLVLGAEMFERHQVAGIKRFLKTGNVDSLMKSEELWNNFSTDYLPFLQIAYKEKIDFISSNVTRKYASLCFKKGPEALLLLPDSIKNQLCPLPMKVDTTLSAYKSLLEENGLNFVYAQAIKDATMAWFILNETPKGKVILHLNGSFHSNFHQGIETYLKYYSPTIQVKTISIVEQKSTKKLKKKNAVVANYIYIRKPVKDE